MSRFALIPMTNLGEESRAAGPAKRGRRSGFALDALEERHPASDRTEGKPTVCVDRAGFRRAEHSPDKDGRCVFCS